MGRCIVSIGFISRGINFWIMKFLLIIGVTSQYFQLISSMHVLNHTEVNILGPIKNYSNQLQKTAHVNHTWSYHWQHLGIHLRSTYDEHTEIIRTQKISHLHLERIQLSEHWHAAQDKKETSALRNHLMVPFSTTLSRWNYTAIQPFKLAKQMIETAADQRICAITEITWRDTSSGSQKELFGT
jgi:hypothetical protein